MPLSSKGFFWGKSWHVITLLTGGPHSVMATTPDSHAGGLGFKSRCRPTKVWSPNTPIPRLQVAMMHQGSLPPKKGPFGMAYAKGGAPGTTREKNNPLTLSPPGTLWARPPPSRAVRRPPGSPRPGGGPWGPDNDTFSKKLKSVFRKYGR